MDFWHLMIKKDDYILSFVDILLCVKYRIQNIFRDHSSFNISRNSDSIFIVLNGPSVKEQDLSVLKGKDVIFVNRGFYHPQYSVIQPRFHFFVDPKMINGTWDLNWLDVIMQMNPVVTFAMPEEWKKNKLRPFIAKGYRFFWLPFQGKCNCIGVSGAAFEFAIKSGYKKIYFTGFEATGLASELLKVNSHFYGVNNENSIKSCYNYEQDLYMMSRQLHDLQKLAKRCKRNGISVYNCTEGGILDMFERKKINETI